MTTEKKTKLQDHAEEGVCPRCGGTGGVVYSHAEVQDGWVSWQMRCSDCNLDYCEEYTMTFAGCFHIGAEEQELEPERK